MTRRELRENTFVLLFRTEFHSSEDMPEQMELYFETQGVSLVDSDREYVQNKVNDIIDNLSVIDEAIDGASEGWEIKRIDKVSLTIMRLAYYEIKYDESIPVKVSINEAVEIAKKFGPDEAPAFVNGILGKLAS